jgi:hypothetical protein
MGQSLVEQGQPAAAREQLVEILARGGAGTWPAEALRSDSRMLNASNSSRDVRL